MRRLKTYPALASIALPETAVILGVHDRGANQAPSLLVSYDEADLQLIERRFIVLQSREAIPPGAQFLESWRRNGCGPNASGIFCLFELGDDLPADLPAEAYPHYRLLIRDGFTPARSYPTSDGLRHSWKAPDDVLAGRLTREQMVAVASLMQDFNYGPVVDA